MRIRLLACLLLPACTTVPVDQNLQSMIVSMERQQATQQAHLEALADSRAKAATACASSPEPAVCSLGQVAMTLAAERSAPQVQNPFPNYQPPRTFGDRVESITKSALSALPGLGGIYASIEANKQERRTNQTLYNTFGGMFNSVAGLGEAALNQPPGIIVDNGGIYSQGDVSQRTGDDIGRDNIGGDYNASGIVGDNNDQRQASDGPIDNSDPGDDCVGDSCIEPVVIVPPVIVPPDGGGP